jgi:hypothetical protein
MFEEMLGLYVSVSCNILPAMRSDLIALSRTNITHEDSHGGGAGRTLIVRECFLQYSACDEV